MYRILFDKKFKRDISKFDKQIRDRILDKVFELEESPELGKHLIGIDLWSLRIGKYRVLYKIEHNKLQVFILTVEHRKDVYRNLK